MDADFISSVYMCTCYIVVFCNHPTVPGVPYFVEVRVMESVRGLGLPRASSVFFSQETGQELSVLSLVHCHSIITLFCHTDADPDAQVSNLNYDMNNNRLSWTPIPLFEARHFFNYTIIATPSSSSTQKRQSPSSMIVPYSNCGDVCSVQLTLSPNTNYSVTVTITRSTNVGRMGNDDMHGILGSYVFNYLKYIMSHVDDFLMQPLINTLEPVHGDHSRGHTILCRQLVSMYGENLVLWCG